MQRNGEAVVVDAPQLLEQHLGLAARVDEHQRGPMPPDEIVHLRECMACRMSGPGQALGGAQHGNDRRGAAFGHHDIGLRRHAAMLGHQIAGEFIRRRHRGGKPDRHQGRRDAMEASEAKCEQIAALRRHQRVQLVEHNALERRKKIRRVGGRQQQRDLLGRGEQDVGRVASLSRALGRGRVAGAGLDADGQAHLGDGLLQVAGDIHGQGLKGGDVERVEAAARRKRTAPEAAAG